MLRRIYKNRVLLFRGAACANLRQVVALAQGFDQVHDQADKLVKAVESNKLSESNLKRICKPWRRCERVERARIYAIFSFFMQR